MRIFGEVLYFFGATLPVLINGLLYLLSSIWVAIVWIYDKSLHSIINHKLIFASMLVSWLVVFVYLIAKIWGY